MRRSPNTAKKAFLLLFGVSIFSWSPLVHGDELEIIHNVVNRYQKEITNAYDGNTIRFEIVNASESNSWPDFLGGSPIIVFTSTLLQRYQDDEIAVTACHEIGHFLGNREMGGKHPYDPRFAGEGEADYFAGSCIVLYFTEGKGLSRSDAIQETVEVANRARSAQAGRRLNPNRAQARSVDQGTIDTNYPDDDCRVLTIINGATGRPRPSCWCNP